MRRTGSPAGDGGVDRLQIMSAEEPRIGVDRPDGRGRTGLDRVGRDLDRNPNVIVRDVEVTSDGWHVLRRTTLDYRRRDGTGLLDDQDPETAMRREVREARTSRSSSWPTTRRWG
jgi:hypothetical protein